MKNSTFLLPFFIVLFSCSDQEHVSQNVDSSVVVESPKISDATVAEEQAKHPAPKYQLLHENTTYCGYEILMPKVNLNNIDYKQNVEAILNDLARKNGKTRFNAWIFDDAKAAKLNYEDLELGKHLSSNETDFVNQHLVAIYSSGFLGEDHYHISYFENVESSKRSKNIAWDKAYNESDYDKGFTPSL